MKKEIDVLEKKYMDFDWISPWRKTYWLQMVYKVKY